MNNSVFKCLLTIALVFSCNIMQAVTKNIREYNLNGNVYCIRVKEYSFYLEFGEMNRGTQKSEYSTYFLKNGNVFIDSLVPQKTYKRYFYDKFNNLTEEMRINVGAGRKIQLGNGNYHYNDTTNHVLYKYNYCADGRIKEILKYIKMGDDVLTQIQRIVYSQTTNGEKVVYWTKSGIDKEEIYGVGTKTTKVYSRINDYKSPVISTKITLNKNGLPIKAVESVGGLVSGESIFTYDEHNNIINKTGKVRNVWGQGENVVIVRRYEYDNKGNWVRQLEYRNGELITWIERDIFYANSDSDYAKIVEDDKKVTEKHLGLFQKEQRVKDSIDNVLKEETARKKRYEDSIIAIVAKLDVIIEKEMLQKHIMAVPHGFFDRYNFDIKLREIDGIIKSFNTLGNTISFILKKGKTQINVELSESRIRKYYWSWDEFSEGKDEFQIGYSSDYNDIVVARPFVLLLHKEDGVYKAYTPDPKIANLYAINNALETVKKEDLALFKEYIQLFWHANKGSVADQYNKSDNNDTLEVDSNEPIYTFYDVEPVFLGGDILKWVSNHRQNEFGCKVHVSFVIEKNGSTSNIKAQDSGTLGCTEEAIRLVKMMKWRPAMKDNEPVRAQVLGMTLYLDN